MLQLRNECLEFYEAWAETVAAGFPRRELADYLDSHFPENGSLAQAHQAALELITLIDSRTGIRAQYAQQKAEANQPRRARLSRAG